MTVSNFAGRLAAAVALFCVGNAAHATLTFGTLTNTAAGSTVTAQNYSVSSGVSGVLDTFSDFTIGSNTPISDSSGSLNRTVYPGPATYTLSSQTALYAVQSPVIGGAAVSVEGVSDTLTFNNFAGVGVPSAVLSFGASFYMSELNAGNAAALSGSSPPSYTLTVRATEVGGGPTDFTFSQNSSNGGPTAYFTLASTVGLQSVQLIGTAANTFTNPLVFATVDNVVLGAVPVPASGVLMLGGLSALGGLGLFKRRRA